MCEKLWQQQQTAQCMQKLRMIVLCVVLFAVVVCCLLRSSCVENKNGRLKCSFLMILIDVLQCIMYEVCVCVLCVCESVE